MDWIKGIFGAVGAFFGYIGERQKLNNSPEMQTAAKAQKDADLKATVVKEVTSTEDEAEIRKRISP